MGREARVFAEIDEWTGEGKLLLELDQLIFRGARKITIPLPTIRSVSVDNGWLVVVHEVGDARFDLGPEYAEKWRHAIENPKTLIDKLDVKAGLRVLIEGAADAAFIESVRARTDQVIVAGDVGSDAVTDLDLIFYHVDDPALLGRIAELRPAVKSTGALWVLHPKGRSDLSHDAILAVAKPLGLIDVKSAKFSDTHAALKLMVPRCMR